MQKILMILEVSQKQNYIFSSKQLKENAERSAQISYVTGSAFFQHAAGEAYSEENNLVYAGGGHTVLQFDGPEEAKRFARRVTETALREFDGLELFAKQLQFVPEKTPKENLRALSDALEWKKAVRRGSFRRLSFGQELLDEKTFQPKREDESVIVPNVPLLEAPQGREYPSKMDELAGDDNFIGVIHIDGNAMGKRVERIYERQSQAWEETCGALRRFSEGIQRDFEQAFREMTDEVISMTQDSLKAPALPLRPVILAGDDVCFVTKGKLALECARIFLEKLTAKRNEEDKQPYAACAGIALVHKKFPFHQAYDLAEELCGNAKKFGALLDADGRISAMDWHIEFGQLKDSLGELRRDYDTQDGNRLELRPVTVKTPEGCPDGGVRSYAFFAQLCRALQDEEGKIARGKIKELRTALKQGEVESRFFMHDKKIDQLLYHAVDAEYGDPKARWALIRRMLRDGERLRKEAFRRLDGEEHKRCLFFDAIEMMDHCTFLGEEKA